MLFVLFVFSCCFICCCFFVCLVFGFFCGFFVCVFFFFFFEGGGGSSTRDTVLLKSEIKLWSTVKLNHYYVLNPLLLDMFQMVLLD